MHKCILPTPIFPVSSTEEDNVACHSIPSRLRFVDLCAGLGGFHHAFSLVKDELTLKNKPSANYIFECVMACEIDSDLRKIYVDNFPSIHPTYKKLYPPLCADIALLDLYDRNDNLKQVHGDLGKLVDLKTQKLINWPQGLEDVSGPIIPQHDILCAGFPCQPFSKSGAQRGFDDIHGTVFEMIAVVIKEHLPPVVFLENVGNFERHDGGNTWITVRNILESLGYTVSATTHVASGNKSQGLLSPHHIGLPHHRERFFIAAVNKITVETIGINPSDSPFSFSFNGSRKKVSAQQIQSNETENNLIAILKTGEDTASHENLLAAKLPQSRIMCIDIWNEFLLAIDAHDKITKCDDEKISPLPSFPIWGYELDPWRWFPVDTNPLNVSMDSSALYKAWCTRHELASSLIAPPEERYLQATNPTIADLQQWVKSWPAYAKRKSWPAWKKRFILQNRKFTTLLISRLDNCWLRSWLDRLMTFSPSLQKLEWNCKGESLNIDKRILQFRPSGLRVKKFCHVPALVAMTTTQIPIVPIQTNLARHELGNDKLRYLMPQEALALQGFPANWNIPPNRGSAYKAFGNAVHAELIKEILLNWLF